MLEDDKKNKGFEKWKHSTQITLEKWKHCFKLLKLTTNDTKLRWIQLRILHNILTTNRSVSKFNKEQSHLCQFCQSHSETIHHLIWKCHKVKLFWDELTIIINKRVKHAHRFKFDENVVIFGYSDQIKTDQVCDLIILLAKFYIYRSKVQGIVLNTNIFIKEIYQRYCIEKEINPPFTRGIPLHFFEFSPKIRGFRIRPFLLMNNYSSPSFCKKNDQNRVSGVREIGAPKR